MNDAAIADAFPAERPARTYVWELPVRLTHWLIFLSMAVLAVTGFYIGHPFISAHGLARDRFVMGLMKVIHFYAAIVFTLAALSRITWMFLGNRHALWDQFVPLAGARRRNLIATLKFYLFLRRTPPETVGHNALSGAVYTVVFLLYLMMIATGFALYSAGASVTSPMRVFRLLIPLAGGLQDARWIHHVGMWLLIGFAAHHLCSAVLMSVTERNGTMESIFSGYKFIRREILGGQDDG